ncbi:MAG: Uma2 family endonuclease [Thermoanaerobaculia bacterium]
MAVHDLPRKLTYDDYASIPEDGQRHEILDGEHYVSPAPLIPHQEVSSNLHTELGPFIKKHRLGKLLAAPTDVILSTHDVVQPDFLFISTQRFGIITRENVQGAPDLIIEILSPGTRSRDEGIKREIYERYGVPEYWLLDPDRKTTRVYRRLGNRLRLVAKLSAGDVLTTPLLPGLEIRLADVFN